MLSVAFSGGVCCLVWRCERFSDSCGVQRFRNPCEGIELTGADGLTGTLLGAPERVQESSLQTIFPIYFWQIHVLWSSSRTNFSPLTGQPIENTGSLCLGIRDVIIPAFVFYIYRAERWWEKRKGLQRSRAIVAKPAFASAKNRKKGKEAYFVWFLQV